MAPPNKTPPPNKTRPGDASQAEEPPPLFGTWRRAYGIVLGTFAVLVALFAYLTRVYR